MTIPDNNFKFAISLSVLNHLGRNLYRSFITVLGEAISNSWDADAKNVWIEIYRNRSAFSIKDDGIGMDRGDFQEKLLNVGYSKRADGSTKTTGGRPYIGAKGIGSWHCCRARKESLYFQDERNRLCRWRNRQCQIGRSNHS